MGTVAEGVTEMVRSVATGPVRAEGVELVDLEFRREPAGWVLRLFIDKTGGVGVEDCQRVSELVGTLLEVEDPIPHAYTLEVSSPGLTRPLRGPQDWAGVVGALVKVVTHEPVEQRQSFLGRVLAAAPDAVRLDVEGSEIEVPHALIARARLEVDWPPARPAGRRGGKAKRGREESGKRQG
jgi:ribosome maturation factor RimP